MLSRLRDVVAPVRRTLAMPLVRHGVSPNALSLLAVPVSLCAAASIVVGWTLCGFALGVLSALIDFVDGEVARLQERSSHFGSCLDAFVDRIVEAALLGALACTWPLLSTCALALGNLVSYIKARTGLVIPLDNHDWPGLGDRSDRMVLILLTILLMAQPFAAAGYAKATLWTLVAVSAVGCLQRLLYARTLIGEVP